MSKTINPPGSAVAVQSDAAEPSPISQMIYGRDTAEQEIRSLEFSAGFHRGRRKAADEAGDADLADLHDNHAVRADAKLRGRRESLKAIKKQLDEVIRRSAR